MKKQTTICIALATATVVFLCLFIWKDCSVKNLEEQLEVPNTSSLLSEELEKKKSENKTLISDISKKEATIKELRTKISDLEKTISSLSGTSSADNLEKIKILESEKVALEEEIDKLNNEIAGLKQSYNNNNNSFLVVYAEDGNIVHKEKVAKGENVANVPNITAKTGYDAAWSEDGTNITEDTVIVANYTAKTYNITYILGRPLDDYYSLCGATQYDENNEVELFGATYVLDFSANTVTNVDDMTEIFSITNNQFTINSTTYTINRKFKVIYAVIGDNSVAAKPAFYNLPTTIRYGETLVFKYFSDGYINNMNRDGTAGDDEGRRAPSGWVIFGADSITYDTSYIEADTHYHIQASDDLLIFVEYSRAPS